MMQWHALALVLAVAAPASNGPPQHRLRKVDLSGQAGFLHQVEVVGAPHLTTTIRLPDSFAAENVSCGGDCVDARSLGQAAEEVAANWVMDLRPDERLLHLWPASLPTQANPATAFRSNIYIGLDGGHVVDVALRLVDVREVVADAVVELGLPEAHTLSPLASAKKRLADWQENATLAAKKEAATKLAGQLNGKTRCRQPAWTRPHRNERMVVRLQQVCTTNATPGLGWMTFTVENRAHTPLPVGDVHLLPQQDDMLAPQMATGVHLEKTLLDPGEKTHGVAWVDIANSLVRRNQWTLSVQAEEPRGDSVRVAELYF